MRLSIGKLAGFIRVDITAPIFSRVLLIVGMIFFIGTAAPTRRQNER
jgi:hypothetical protein